MSDNELLERRVSFVEQEVEGEKLVTRHILEQTRRNSEDLGTLKSDVRGLRSDVDGLRRDVDRLRQDLDGLRRDMPGIVTASMREVMKEGGR